MKAYGQFAELENILECLTAPKRPSVTFDVDICFSGSGDTLAVVSLTAKLSVLVHTCNWHMGRVKIALSLMCVLNTTNPQSQLSAKYLEKSGVIFQYYSQKDTFSTDVCSLCQRWITGEKCLNGEVRQKWMITTHLGMTHYFINL